MMIVNVMKNEAEFFLYVIMHEMKAISQASIYGKWLTSNRPFYSKLSLPLSSHFSNSHFANIWKQ